MIVGILPLKNDFLENRAPFRTLFHLFCSAPVVIAPYLDELLLAFAAPLDPPGPDQLGDEVRAELMQKLCVGVESGELCDDLDRCTYSNFLKFILHCFLFVSRK